MIDFDNLPKHALVETIVDDLVVRTDADCRDYFRVLVSYYFAKVAASMRAMISTPDQSEDIPVNCFAITLAPSGFGKGKSVGALERGIIRGFRSRFTEDTFPLITEEHLWGLASSKAAVSGKTEEKEKERIDKLYREAGSYVFTSKSATASSIQQLRGKLLMSTVGAINIQVDEIGSNITDMGVSQALNVFLELYDMGQTEIAMTKNTSDNTRMDDLTGISPANLLVFGEPTKLFDGAQVENAFMQLLSTGYARRCLFAWGDKPQNDTPPSPEEVLKKRMAARKNSVNAQLRNHFSALADPSRHNWLMEVPEDVALHKTAYEILCGERAKEFPSQDSISRAEMEHRHWKALKLAGALAFADESLEVTMDHLLAAIGIVEESGKAFQRMLRRDKPYVRLAKHIAEAADEVTHADLHEDLPFYPSGNAAQNGMIDMARSWAYKNHIILKKRFEDGIELISGEMLEETNLEEMLVSYSDHFAYDYRPERAPWKDLHQLTQADGMQWCNHHFEKDHRSDDNTIPGFNMVVYDFDGGVSLDVVHDLMSEYSFMTYTTKRHTDESHRFRLILPINYVLKLDKKDYKTFVEGLSEWLPVQADLSDDSSKQRSKKWMSHANGAFHVNDGKLIDCFPFIPRTKRHDEHVGQMKSLQSLNNLERWFAQRIASGNRNNQMIKFALALVDSGMPFTHVEQAVLDFNSKLSNGLDEDEIRSTILVTVAKKIATAA